ncbi:28238_t:CDS:2, partial [Gigaspora margarita]
MEIKTKYSKIELRINHNLEIFKRNKLFVFGFSGGSDVGKTFLISKVKEYLLENDIKENEILITRELRDVIRSLNGKGKKLFVKVDNLKNSLIESIGSFINKVEFDLIIKITRDFSKVLDVKKDNTKLDGGYYSEKDLEKIYFTYENDVTSFNFGDYKMINFVNDIQYYINLQTDEYLIKSKVVGTNNLHIYVLISGFSVYFEIKINEVDDPKNIKVDYQKVKDVYCEIKNYQNAKVLDKTCVDLIGTPCVFMRMEFINHFKRKKEIQRLRNLIKEKKIDFELYEDDISTSYLMFISVRTRVKFLDLDKEVAFPLWVYFQYESVTGYGSQVEKGENAQEFLKTMFQIYKNFNPDKESRWNNLGYDWKFIIRKLYEFEQVKISASETATHYFIKTDGIVHYTMQTQLQQHFKTLQNWKLNDILKKMGLNPKEDLSIEE